MLVCLIIISIKIIVFLFDKIKGERLRFLRYIFCALLFVTASVADTININWMDGNTTYAQTTCEIGGDIILPSPPTKRGYTFKGWVAGYTRLEYIESTGTQYIDTGVAYTDGISIDIKFSTNKSADSSAFLFGFYLYQDAFGVNTRSGWDTSTGVLMLYSASDTKSIAVENKTINIISFRNNKYYYNNSELWSPSIMPTDRTSSIGLFAPIKAIKSYPFIGKIYSVTISNVCNLIPARRNSDNTIGMYDTVSGWFFTNAGTGEFIAGPVAENQNFYE